MAGSLRLYAFFILLSGLLAAIGVLALRTGGGSAGEAVPPLRAAVDLIAYVDSDGSIHLVRPDRTPVDTISPGGGFFTWPAWAPDATQIAFSGTSSSRNGRGPLSMYLYKLGGDGPEIIYTNEPGIGPILPDMPHYPLWAPDGAHLAIMAGHPQGLTLFLTEPRAGADVATVLRNAPLYASWSADSRYILVHGGVDHFTADLAVGPQEGIKVLDLGVRSDTYRAPAWWPSGNRMTVLSENDRGRRVLYTADIDSGEGTTVEEVPGEVAFLWSPDGESLAVAHSNLADGLIYRGVALFSHDSVRRPLGIGDDVFAFFWSPDSSKLAYVTPADRGVFRWMVLDVTDGSRRTVVDFIPSDAQVTVFRFFDQFAYSHSPWSPDSASLVFAGALPQGGVSASLGRQPVSSIIVADIEPDGQEARVIAEGFLAVWSPR